MFINSYVSLFLALAANCNYCGNMPTVTNPRTIQWWHGDGSYVNRAYLEVLRVANIRSQLPGCLNAVKVTSQHVSRFSSYALPSVDYNSLYIAKVLWLDSSDNAHYSHNSDCYFIPQRREYLYAYMYKNAAGISHCNFVAKCMNWWYIDCN